MYTMDERQPDGHVCNLVQVTSAGSKEKYLLDSMGGSHDGYSSSWLAAMTGDARPRNDVDGGIAGWVPNAVGRST